MDYEVKLEIFEGPLDLLLHLILKNEVDIFDIPMATITDQYLEYIEMMKALNISVAGDFLVMASTLIYIKSKMLLPDLREGEEEEDPRLEITRPLLEYMRLKEMAEELSEREMLGLDVFPRQDSSLLKERIDAEGPRLNVSLFQLMDAFKRIMDQNLLGVQLSMQLDKWSIKDKSQMIIARLKQDRSVFFKALFCNDRSLSEFIVTFLALLELVHAGLVKLFQPSIESDIRLVGCFDGDEGNGEGEEDGGIA